MGTKFTLTVLANQNATIESILDNTSSQRTLIDNIVTQINSHHLNGVIVDFEYNGKPDATYQQKFTAFVQTLSQTLHTKAANATLSLTLMPLAGRERGLFDFPKLVPYVDRLIGMTYDYYGMSADIAGPIAPMNGFKENKFFFDVTTTYEDYLKYIPKNKIVMGIPYYGWDWAVMDGKTINRQTFFQNDPNNYTAVISYARVHEDRDLKPNQCQWDSYAEENWCWYTDKKTQVDHQVWLEDNQSIGIKFDYAKKQNFNGIPI